jgi:deoxyadenosine/deoxycytidine kinase
MKTLFTTARSIAVEGPLRVGKSTLARLLAEQMNARTVIEPENNPFLDRFYRQEPGTAFSAQMWFLLERYERLRAAQNSTEVVERPLVTDFIFEKDKLFAYANLSDAELAIYNRYYERFSSEIAAPGLVIYLQAKPQVLKTRLKRKAAAGERAVSEKYIARIADAYEHFFFHYTAANLLVVNTSEIDFVNNPQHRAQLLERIAQPVHGMQYFQPHTI